MKINQELIDKFFAGQCTPEEAKRVSHYLNDKKALEKYIGINEWESFVPKSTINDTVSHHMREAIFDRIHQHKRLRMKRIRRLSYAASIVLVSCATLFFYLSKQTDKLSADPVIKAPVRIVSEKAAPKLFTNDSKTVIKATLPDGSIISLSPNSTVSYLSTASSREVTLKGEAVFNVHKDKKHPFTVFSNNLSTTALGTVFKVTAYENQKYTSVKLLEGKVVIKSRNPSMPAIKETYLLAGNMFVLNNQNYTASVKSFISPVRKENSADREGYISINENAITFHNKPLSSVFATLEEQFKIQITYRKSIVENKVYSGQYDFSRDDIDSFLNTLAVINDLKVNKKGGVYEIETDYTKRHQ